MMTAGLIALGIIGFAGYEFGVLAVEIVRSDRQRMRGAIGLGIWASIALVTGFLAVSVFPSLHDRLFVPIVASLFGIQLVAGAVWRVVVEWKERG